jgi:hypothetical protein
MKNTILRFVLIAALVFFLSCNQKNSKIDPKTYFEFQSRGASISNISQVALLTNVKKAMTKGGPVYALEFCNAQASSIIDSLNSTNNCVISRVSAKNRNPENGLSNKMEKKLWILFQNNLANDTLIQNKGKLIYYKPIKIGITACLKCHGNPEFEINSATFDKLQKLYPNDLATGYKLKDFRGLWKIEFKKK